MQTHDCIRLKNLCSFVIMQSCRDCINLFTLLENGHNDAAMSAIKFNIPMLMSQKIVITIHHTNGSQGYDHDHLSVFSLSS